MSVLECGSDDVDDLKIDELTLPDDVCIPYHPIFPEIIAVIVEFLVDDVQSLKYCSLFRRDWTYWCQQHIFHSVKLSLTNNVDEGSENGEENVATHLEKPPSRWDRLNILLDESPHLISHIRCLDVSNRNDDNCTVISDTKYTAAILGRLASLHTLGLYDINMHVDTSLWSALSQFKDSFPAIRTLILGRFVFKCWSSCFSVLPLCFPSVQIFKIMTAQAVSEDFFALEDLAATYTPVQLTALHLNRIGSPGDYDDEDDFNRGLVDARLRRIVDWSKLAHLEEMGNMRPVAAQLFSSAGESLEWASFVTLERSSEKSLPTPIHLLDIHSVPNLRQLTVWVPHDVVVPWLSASFDREARFDREAGRRHSLERLSINLLSIVQYDDDNDEGKKEERWPGWKHLDRLLCRFSGLGVVEIYGLKNDENIEELRMELKGLSGRGVRLNIYAPLSHMVV